MNSLQAWTVSKTKQVEVTRRQQKKLQNTYTRSDRLPAAYQSW